MIEKPVYGGAVRTKNERGEWVVTNPGTPLYSTALMIAQESWNGKEWIVMWPDEDEHLWSYK